MMTRRYKLVPAVGAMTKQSQRRVSHLQLHSPPALSWSWHIGRASKNMDYTLALLLSLLQLLSVGTAAPVPVEVVKMKSKVKWMAEQLVVKVDKDFPVTHGTLWWIFTKVMELMSDGVWLTPVLASPLQFPVSLTCSQTTDDLGGLSSIVTVLESYNSLISDTLFGVSQVKTEILSLTGYLNQWRQGNCKEQRQKPLAPGPLQELQSRKGFIHTVSIEALMRVKEFLNLLLKNLDLLETCWMADRHL